MTQLARAAAAPPTADSFLKDAAHRHRAISRDGLMERLFTRAFGRLVYAQIWEDPECDLDALQLSPGEHVVAIASGGCNVLSYLSAGPVRVTAVDLNPAHVALCELKIAAARALDSHDDFSRFLRLADRPDNAALFDRKIAPLLDPRTRAYWNGADGLGRRRVSAFNRNIYRTGLLGRFIGTGHLLARILGADLTGLLECTTQDEQERFFDSHISPAFDRWLTRRITAAPPALYGLGIPPAQFETLRGDEEMADVLRARLRRLAAGFSLETNYFAWQAFARRYPEYLPDCVPPYLRRRNFETLRERVSGLSVVHGLVDQVLARQPARSVDAVVLLDAQDWMSDDRLNALWEAITHAAAPGARVIFRTSGEQTVLDGRLRKDLADRWHYDRARSVALHARDRSAIYGGFHLYRLAGDAS